MAAADTDGTGGKAVPACPVDLATLVEGTLDCVYTLGRDWRFTFLNRRAERVLGKAETLIGRTLWETFPDSIGSLFEENYRKAMETGESVSFEAFYPPDYWAEIHATGTPQGLAVFFRDVSKRRSVEAELRATE